MSQFMLPIRTKLITISVKKNYERVQRRENKSNKELTGNMSLSTSLYQTYVPEQVVRAGKDRQRAYKQSNW